MAQPRIGRLCNIRKNADGYLEVRLSKDGKTRYYKVHRLVANEFVQTIDNGLEVNHIDFDRTNNVASNLEVCTHRDNIAHSHKHGRYSIRDMRGNKNPNYGNHILKERYKDKDLARITFSRPGVQNGRCVPIAMYDANMNLVKTFDYLGECCQYLIDITKSRTTVDSMRSKISESAKSGKQYLNYYFKKTA